VCAREDGEEGILQLLQRRVPDRLLPDADVPRDGVEQLQRANLQPGGAERGARRVGPGDRRGLCPFSSRETSCEGSHIISPEGLSRGLAVSYTTHVAATLDET
jgi:hypothetical protein